jgi:hypothetical protein
MITLKKWIIALIFAFILLTASSGNTTAWNHFTSYDFHEVQVGSSKHANVSVTNITYQNVTVFFSFNSTSEFVWFPEPLDTIEIASNSSINLDIAFIPGSAGLKSASLTITDGTPFNSSQINFFGTGIEKKSEVSIEDIIDFFDSAVFFGDIVGFQTGGKSTDYNLKNIDEKIEGEKNNNSSQNRLNAFRNMILSVANEIEEKNFLTACGHLSELYVKTDGKLPPVSPPDFIDGESKQELARMLVALRQQFECD